jgi:hypothetical protein
VVLDAALTAAAVDPWPRYVHQVAPPGTQWDPVEDGRGGMAGDSVGLHGQQRSADGELVTGVGGQEVPLRAFGVHAPSYDDPGAVRTPGECLHLSFGVASGDRGRAGEHPPSAAARAASSGLMARSWAASTTTVSRCRDGWIEPVALGLWLETGPS